MTTTQDLVNAPQSGDVWLSWRSKGIGSSDAPAIMGASPWRTRLELYYEKLSPVMGSRVPNYAQQRGIDMEPRARALYELINEMDMPATLFEHPEYPFLRASLDGWNAEHKVILEIKCPGKDDHGKAKDGKVPEKYVWQLEHQLLVSGAKRADYFSYYVNPKTKEEDHALVVYFSNPEKREALLKAELEFWECIVKKTPPPPTEQDVVELTAPEQVEHFQKMRRKKLEIDALTAKLAATKEQLDELRDQAIMWMPHAKVRAAGVELHKTERLGNVDLDKLLASGTLPAGTSIDDFRKPSSVFYSVKIAGKE